jgi:uncharacterized protein (TIGR03067 family)
LSGDNNDENKLSSKKEHFVMRMMMSCFLSCFSLVCFSGVLLRCDNGSPTGPGAGPTELEGTWTGRAVWDTATYTITFAQNNFSFKSSALPATTDAYSGTFTNNPGANPKQMDSYIAQCSLKPQYVGKTSLCIYKISNDTLTYAGNEPGNTQRPISFAPDTSGTTVVFILKRQ